MLFSTLPLQRCGLQLLQGCGQLVGTGGELVAAADALQPADDIVDALSCHQLAYSLQVTVTATKEKHLLYHVVLVCRHIDDL